ncbi:hypothetical protein HPP92_007306 [Vanilla planifolia]|uniref:Uncharacterized protein n=1 Tax=Vanilla planifolia TaxID=51239 RepID=A0A835RA76_VANPL|nr:hypothetical protein HPP92_007306 [Vanilla planifolia]
MASSWILSFLAFAVLAGTASARPGVQFHPFKTCFVTYTFTSSETFDVPQIFGPRDGKPPYSSVSTDGYIAAYRFFSSFRLLPSSSVSQIPISNFRPIVFNRPRFDPAVGMVRAEQSFGISSLQERAKDILVVVAGLLFGVGCGALTGAIMYLAWSLFSNQCEIYRSHDGEDEVEEKTPKKMGYVKIGDIVPLKESYDGN